MTSIPPSELEAHPAGQAPSEFSPAPPTPKVPQRDPKPNSCPICQEDIAAVNKYSKLRATSCIQCNGHFHENCLKE